MSQESFADRCGLARSYMSRVERGVGNPSLDAIEVFAVALGVPVADLFITAPPAKTAMAARATGKKATSIAKPVQVPFAKDGTCFNPALRQPRSGRYVVGPKAAEVEFETFDAALRYLKRNRPARWRRPNAAGNWGIVQEVEWGPLPSS